MVHDSFAAPWHWETFHRFLHHQFPEMLATRIPLESYSVEPGPDQTCTIRVALTQNQDPEYPGGAVQADLSGIPIPDDSGIFRVEGKELIVIPLASGENLEEADIRCVGEQIKEFIELRLGEAPPDLVWDGSLIQSWLPVSKWVLEFLLQEEQPWTGTNARGQFLDNQNGISRREHLRRLIIPDRSRVVADGQLGLICPIQTPEGPNVGRVVAISRGATITNRRLISLDSSPEGKLSVTASMIPFLSSNDPMRSVMGTNMMRQWHVPAHPEPAWIQTGLEPDEPDIWCGQNLLTAFVSLGEATFEDGIVISESCAARFNYEGIIEPGDKLSNRHGTKGVISGILPDDEMPHLEDGTPVELVYSFIGQHTRMNFGQILEACVSRIAHCQGRTITISPFASRDQLDLKEQLQSCGLPEMGMEILRLGKNGSKMTVPSTAGWVYWGLTIHLARRKVFTCKRGFQRQGQMEYYVLRDLGAFRIIRDVFNRGSAERDDPQKILNTLAKGLLPDASSPTPVFIELQKRLNVAGIRMDINNGRIRFEFQPPAGETLTLACDVKHPWLPHKRIQSLGALPDEPEFLSLKAANNQMLRVLNGHSMSRLAERSRENLQKAVDRMFENLIERRHLRLSTRVVLSARAVVAPGIGLDIHHVGIPNTIAWDIFEPFLIAELGDSQAVKNRSQSAEAALDKIMSRSWTIINRAPSLTPTALLAFHPVRIPDNVIRLHPIACALLNADYDGDQVAIILPIAPEAQTEAGEKLSIKGHLVRDPNLLDLICPRYEALWGIVHLARTPAGMESLQQLLDMELHLRQTDLTRDSLICAAKNILTQNGADAVLEIISRLWNLGFEHIRTMGASVCPFGPDEISFPPEAGDNTEKNLLDYFDKLKNNIITAPEKLNCIETQMLAVKSGARGDIGQLTKAYAGWVYEDILGNWRLQNRGIIHGLDPDELFHLALFSRKSLGNMTNAYHRMGEELWQSTAPKGMHIMARAARFRCPGYVFARAAATGETDPLIDMDTRLFAGLDVDP